MAVGVEKLTDRKVQAAKAGVHIDGRGLRLKVSARGAKSWVFRFTFNGKEREMGLGAYPSVSLKAARERAAIAREQVALGNDPLASRPEVIDRRKTFGEIAVEYMDKIKLPTWKHGKDDPKGSYHSWASTLRDYVYPSIGERSIDEVCQDDIDHILKDLWVIKTETATRVRQRLENILSYAISKKYRDATLGNPAQWKYNLQATLPDPKNFQEVKHHPSLPYDLVPKFWTELQELGGAGVCSRALSFAILTGVRTQAVREARWEQFDFKKAVWTVPARFNKAKLEIDVPLRSPMIDILETQLKLAAPNAEYVFPQDRQPDKMFSENGMLSVLKRLGYGRQNTKAGKPNITVHGFRSSAREWLAAETSHSNEICETFLGHRIGTAVTAAYFRSSGQAYAGRVGAQEDWAKFVVTGAPAYYSPKPKMPKIPEPPKSLLLARK